MIKEVKKENNTLAKRIDLPKYKLIDKSITPSKEELEENNRARSSRLRGIQRIRD